MILSNSDMEVCYATKSLRCGSGDRCLLGNRSNLEFGMVVPVPTRDVRADPHQRVAKPTLPGFANGLLGGDRCHRLCRDIRTEAGPFEVSIKSAHRVNSSSREAGLTTPPAGDKSGLNPARRSEPSSAYHREKCPSRTVRLFEQY